MTISSLSPDSSLLAALSSDNKQQSVQNDFGVTVLKKANDQMTQEGQALINMIEQTGATANPYHLDTYA